MSAQRKANDVSTLTPERLREAADVVGRAYVGGLDLAHDLRVLASELEGSTQPPLPTRDEIAQCIEDAMLPPREPAGASFGHQITHALVAAGWVRVSGRDRAVSDLANFTVTVDSVADLWLRCHVCHTDLAGGGQPGVPYVTKLDEFVAIACAHECRVSGETP